MGLSEIDAMLDVPCESKTHSKVDADSESESEGESDSDSDSDSEGGWGPKWAGEQHWGHQVYNNVLSPAKLLHKLGAGLWGRLGAVNQQVAIIG